MSERTCETCQRCILVDVVVHGQLTACIISASEPDDTTSQKIEYKPTKKDATCDEWRERTPYIFDVAFTGGKP